MSGTQQAVVSTLPNAGVGALAAGAGAANGWTLLIIMGLVLAGITCFGMARTAWNDHVHGSDGRF